MIDMNKPNPSLKLFIKLTDQDNDLFIISGRLAIKKGVTVLENSY